MRESNLDRRFRALTKFYLIVNMNGRKNNMMGKRHKCFIAFKSLATQSSHFESDEIEERKKCE